MQLKEYITEVLVQIVEGVREADERLGIGHINPTPRGDNNLGTIAGAGYIPSDQQSLIQQVKFDVAVTTTDGTETKGGIGIMIAPLALGSQGKSDRSVGTNSRIQFQVPLALPRRSE